MPRLRTVVDDLGADVQLRAAGCELRPDEHAPLRHVQRRRLDQPDVAIDPCAFVEPAFTGRRVDAHRDHVAGAVVEEIGEIDTERRVAALVASDDVAVAEDHAVAEHAVELDGNAATEIARRNLERAPIPADAGLGKLASQRLEAVRRPAVFLGLRRRRAARGKRQLDGPIVRQVHLPPVAIVELQLRRCCRPVARLRERALVLAEVEVAVQIEAVAEMKAPVEVQEQLLPGGRARRRRRGRTLRHLSSGQRRGAERQRQRSLQDFTPREPRRAHSCRRYGWRMKSMAGSTSLRR